jgi:molybdopterin adenylyltransferase
MSIMPLDPAPAVGVLTISDRSSAGVREDVSGPRIVEWCKAREYRVHEYSIVPDETSAIVSLLTQWADDGMDLIITTGGTGFTRRDVTPEATRAVLDREAPGIAEEIRRKGLNATPYSIIARGVAGIRGRTLIVNCPGSPGGVSDSLAVLEPVVDHAIALLRGDDAPHGIGGDDNE